MQSPAPRSSPWAATLAPLRRAVGALAAALAGALLAGAVSGALRASMDRRGGAAREAALFAPLAVLAASVLVPLALALSGDRARRLAARATGDDPRTAVSALLLAPSAVVLWVALAAAAGRYFMTAFHHVGLAALAQGVALAALALAALAATAVARRLLETSLPTRGLGVRAVASALGAGALLALALIAVGVATGDAQGHGRLLGAYGVLKKPELDLSPVYGLAAVFVLAGLLALAAARSWFVALPLFIASVLLASGVWRHAADHFAESPSAAVIEARPGIARLVLRAARHRDDRDRDGASAHWGGGDCDDRDARRNPDAPDVPGNGVDEDCSGRDAPRPAPAAPPPVRRATTQASPRIPADMNLLVITVDTLRWDLHYAGNPHEISPNLDRLAAEAVVFDHGYALSSYTGRAIGPLMTGRYPTECPRDSGHFTQYPSANVFLAERLAAAGFHTMGAASHFYFERRFGLAQGVTDWDMSAQPSGGNQETTSTDAQVADRAIAMLQDPANNSRRFFLWAHFFDPHKQYVNHPEVPSFGSGERAHYEGEVAWSDRQVGRILAALAAQPFGARTMVVITADHGEAFGEHDMSWHGIELWDVLVRVPWLMRVPGLTPRHVAVPRSQIDMVPTLLELLHVPPPPAGARDALSGVSLVPDLTGEPMPARPIYIELPEGPFNSMRRSVIADGWKLTERGTRRFELYNLADDPGELHDLAATAPADLARMRLFLEQVRGGLSVVAAEEPRSRSGN